MEREPILDKSTVEISVNTDETVAVLDTISVKVVMSLLLEGAIDDRELAVGERRLWC